MLNIIKKSFKILKNNLIFIQPLLFCLLVWMSIFTFFVNKNVYFVGKICLVVSILLLVIAFTAGWLFINKLGIISYNENDTSEEIANKAIQNIKKFFDGIGVCFMNTLGAYILIALLSGSFIYFVSNLLMNTIGEPELLYEIPKLIQANSQAEILTIVNGISNQDKIVFSLWVLISNAIFFFVSYISVLYFAVINFEEENFLKSIWITIKFLFKNFISSMLLIFFIFVLYLAFNFVSLLFGTNSFALVLLIILYSIYLNYCVLLIFCFYNDKTKNNSDNRSEFIREDKVSN